MNGSFPVKISISSFLDSEITNHIYYAFSRKKFRQTYLIQSSSCFFCDETSPNFPLTFL